MKKILITGANSYIGTSFERYIKHNHNKLVVDTVDMCDKEWKSKDFSLYDVLFHVAGIAHSDDGNISKEKELLYYAVNTELSWETAKKAKQEGVKQFIFMSSIIVFGEGAPIGKEKKITYNTDVSPLNCYGDSKVQAEKRIMELSDENFKVVILRPPMIYGKGSKGNYPLLSLIAQKSPVFPCVNNQRSILYIENLLEFVWLMIDNDEEGIFYPQNKEHISTSELVGAIAKVHGKKIFFIKRIIFLLKFASAFSSKVNKAFGSLAVDMSMSEYKKEYRIVSFEESIRRTEA